MFCSVILKVGWAHWWIFRLINRLTCSILCSYSSCIRFTGTVHILNFTNWGVSTSRLLTPNRPLASKVTIKLGGIRCVATMCLYSWVLVTRHALQNSPCTVKRFIGHGLAMTAPLMNLSTCTRTEDSAKQGFSDCRPLWSTGAE